MKYQSMKDKNLGRYILNTKTCERTFENENPEEYKKLRAKWLKNLNAANRDNALRDLGLTKVRGSVSGKIYWE